MIQQIRQASQGMWADAQRPGGLARNEIQGQVIERELLNLIEQDPVGASKSWVGDMMLGKYAWMMTPEDVCAKWGAKHFIHALKNNTYPYRFEIADIMGEHVKEIVEQMIADEYFMDGPEQTPYTLEAVRDVYQGFQDPFMRTERPDVTVEIAGEIYNEGGQIQTKPKQGFREIA